ncbi:MAG TPA: crossover junction endodeoxyribonuclease RuvC [bacterium]|nr:crossover junction endodeoxyribonuclease RuvC [bacterium]
MKGGDCLLILGIDPGSYRAGYGLVEKQGTLWTVHNHGVLCAPRHSGLPERLKMIYEQVMSLIEQTKPQAAAVEEVFVSRNVRTSLVLGHTRGVIVLAAAQCRVPVFEYSPREIKQSVTGNGGAAKQQVRWMMGRLLPFDMANVKEDAADALAVAYCHGVKSQSVFFS